MEATTSNGTLGDQIARLRGKIPLKKTDRERSMELTAMKADDLRVIAKGLGLTGYSSMKKDGLVAAIVTDEIEKGLVIVAQPDMPAADAKSPTNGNGNGTAMQAAPAASKGLKVGDELTGTVSGINPNVGGMFVTLPEGKSGLAHERQIGLEGESRRTFMARLRVAFNQGDTVAVRVTRITWNEEKKKDEHALELIGASRELFKNATIQQQEEQEQMAAGNEPVQRQTTDDDEVMFRLKEAVGPVADILLALDLDRVVEEGLNRSGGRTRQQVFHLKDVLAEKGSSGVRSFIDGFRHDTWAGRVFSRVDAKNIAYAFTGIALGCLPGMPRQNKDALWAAIQPFMSGNNLPPEHRAYDFADIISEEITLAKRAAAETRAKRVKETVSVFDLVSGGRLKPLAKDVQAAGRKLEPGVVYDGKVVSAAEWGVFVTMTGQHEGLKGLVHVSVMAGQLRPGIETQERLNEKYPPNTAVRVKYIETTKSGISFQFEEDAATVKAEARIERGRYPRVGDFHPDATVVKIGEKGDTIVVSFNGWRGAVYVGDIGWPVPRNDAERADSKKRLTKTFPEGRELCVEVIRVERKPDRQGIMRDRFGLKTIPPEEFARRKGGSHGQGGGSHTASTARSAAGDDAEAERATASPAEEQEEQRETVDVDLDTVMGKPVECKQNPDNGTCVIHTNGQAVTMMPGEHFCRMGKELIRQGGEPVSVEKEEQSTAPKAEVTKRGDGNGLSFMINAVTLKELVEAIGEQANEGDLEILAEIREFVRKRTLITREQAWAEKERMFQLGRKYGVNDELMDRLIRRSYGTVEQVEQDAKVASEKAYRARLVAADVRFICMANGGLGGHKTSWFMDANRTNQLHLELVEILTAVVPKGHSARHMAERIAKEAEDGLPLCLRCADLRLRWVYDLLAEEKNGLILGKAHQELMGICPANNSGQRPRVFTLVNREPHLRAHEAYEEALAQREERTRVAEAIRDPAPRLGDSPETARVKKVTRAQRGGAFSQNPRPAADYTGQKKDKAIRDALIRAEMRGGSGGDKSKNKGGKRK